MIQKLAFEKHTAHGGPVWFCGIYKIAQYEFYGNPARSMPDGEYCYQVYTITGKQWGNYINRQEQGHKALTFDQCVKLAEEHASSYSPTTKELSVAEAAKNAYIFGHQAQS